MLKQLFTYFAILLFMHSVYCLPAKSRFGPPTTLDRISTCFTNCVSKSKNDIPRHNSQYHNQHYDIHKEKKEKSGRYSINRYIHGKRMDHHHNEILKIERLEIDNSAAASSSAIRPSYPNLGK